MLNTLSPPRTALFIGLALLAIIIGAWIFEFAGYPPCELCLMQRWAYYGGIPLSLLLAVLKPSWIRPGLMLLGLVLAANAVFGAYHAGVEWGFWPGPTTCGGGSLSQGLPDLTKRGVMCNEAAIRIAGLSLAGWNAVICTILAALAWRGSRAVYGSSSVSQ
jgi:disulfide bond formation protein DsbB